MSTDTGPATGHATTWLSQEAHDRLQAQLAEMSGARRTEIVGKIEIAREEGDLKENGGYHAAKEEQGKLESRIRQLTLLLRDVRVGGRPSGETVEQGCVVTLDYGDRSPERFLFANRENATDEGGKIGSLDVYSPESPIGQALIGLKQGDAVTFGPRDIAVIVEDISPYEG